ncbi:ABC transporter substrate-binding protein [Pseudomonas sp. Pseu.R1]|uniref:ABC transporter substrate-binding protein n=1 Tax=Pseudomonas sp. Pseu.R1 TaxID=3379818 RepID=UPI003B967483
MKPLALFCLLCCLTGIAQGIELTPAETAGKRLYREGLSASGADVSARIGVSGAIVPAATVPCAGCHGADGRGRPEGGVRPPDITWRRLSTPYGQQLSRGRNHPPYSDSALSHAVIEGIDPGGNRLDSAMPRFVMSAQDQLNLLAYLKRLEDDRDPGVHASTLRLGTLLPTQGPMAALGDTLAAILKGSLARINEDGGIHGRQLELQILDPGPDAQSAKAALQVLTGEQGVFALVSPLVPALDGQLGELLEQAQVPLVGSVSLLGGDTDSPMMFEPLPGTAEQLRTLGRYAANSLNLSGQRTLIVYQDNPLDRHQADTLKQDLNAQGWRDVSLLGYPADRPLAGNTAMIGAKALFFLGRPTDFGAMVRALQLQGAAYAPYVFAASAHVPADVWSIPGTFSRRVFLAYPFTPDDWTPQGRSALARIRERTGLKGQYPVLQVDAYCSVLLLAQGLRQIGRNPARGPLIQALEGLHDVQTGLTPMLGFGPGRRVGMTDAQVVTVDAQRQRFERVGTDNEVNRVSAAN